MTSIDTARHAAVTLGLLTVILSGCGRAGHIDSIDLVAQPGTVVIVPFDQPVSGKRVRAQSVVPASPIVEPTPLPQGAATIYASLYLHGSGDVAGVVLVLLPRTASGSIAFSLAASGQGGGTGGSARFFGTESIDVTIHVAGAAPEAEVPDFSGEWQAEGQRWSFTGSANPALRIRYSTGEEKRMNVIVYPGTDGRWLLVSSGAQAAAYVVELDGKLLRVDYSSEEFKPFLVLQRE